MRETSLFCIIELCRQERSVEVTFSKTEKIVYDLSEPIAKEAELTIYDVEFVKEGGNHFLRVFLDKNGGISLDECEEFSRLLSEALDKADPISQNYYLEVSSPGIERKLKRDFHFEMNKGQIVDVGLYKAVKGSKKLTGELVGLDADRNVVLIIDGETVKIPLKETTVINVHFDF